MALPLLAVSLTDSPALVAGVTVASRLPWLVFALVAGARVDRIDRRRAMVVVALVRCALLVGLAALVLADAATIWMLYLVAFVLGMLETVFDTATQTIIPAIVERDRLSTANGRLFGVELLANQFVGPPVGGFLAALGIAAAFGVTAAGYLGAALLIASLSGVFRAERQGPPTSMRHEIWEGIRFLAGHPLLRTLALVVGGLNLAGGAAMAVLVLYAVEPGPMGLDAVGYGLLLTVIAAGTLSGWLCDRHGAERLAARPGRGRRSSWSQPPLPRLSNLILAAGSTAPSELERSLKLGLVVDRLGGATVDPVSGRTVILVEGGWEVRNGHRRRGLGRLELVGDVLRVLAAVDPAVGNDPTPDWRLGWCVKGGWPLPTGSEAPSLLVTELQVL